MTTGSSGALHRGPATKPDASVPGIVGACRSGVLVVVVCVVVGTVTVDVPSSASVEREFTLNGMEINGKTMDMARVDFVVDHDGPEIWHVTNENDDMLHNFHIHNARFAVKEVKNGKVEFTSGWHDTIDVPPKSTVTLLVEIGYYPDPTVAYMYHCHMLNHEDHGMMGQFVVVEPGQEPDLALPNGHEH